MEDQQIHIMIADCHREVRQGMKALLFEHENMYVTCEAADGLQTIRLAARLNPDILIMDLSMPDMDGVEVIRQILSIHPYQQIIILTFETSEEKKIAAMEAGARRCLTKDGPPEELVWAILEVYAEEPILFQKPSWNLLEDLELRVSIEATQEEFLPMQTNDWPNQLW